MIRRVDHKTAHIVDMAITMRECRGELAAARFLDRNNISIEISVRVLSVNVGRCRPVPSSHTDAEAIALIRSRRKKNGVSYDKLVDY